MTAAAGAGISAFSSIVGSISAGKTSRAKSRMIGETSRANIGYAKNNYMRRSEIAFQQQEAIDRELGRVLSQRGLDAMKAKASLTAGAASTGLSGASIEEVVDESDFHQILDNQVLMARAEKDKVDVFRSRLADYMTFKATNLQATQATKQNEAMQANPLLSAIGAGLGTYSQTQQFKSAQGGNWDTASKSNPFVAK